MMPTEFGATARRLSARTIQKIGPRPAAALAGLAATATLSAGLAGAPLAQASVRSVPAGVTGHQIEASGPSTASAAHINSVWTVAHLRAARDADRVAVKPEHVGNPGAHAHALKPANAGQPGKVAAAAPTQALAGGIRPAPKAHHGPSDLWPGNLYQPPATTTGEVFFTTTGGGYTQYWKCTGEVVNSGGKNDVVTAGHCVYGNLGGAAPGEGWHSNWMFVPDYDNGYEPYGVWTARQLWTLGNYINSGGSGSDEADDIGAAVLNTNSAGQHIVDVVGGQGIAWNYPDNQYVYDLSYGYGSALSYCSGSEFDWGYVIPGTMGLYCPGTNDGGPWLASFNDEFGYVNGVNDFSYSSYPNYTFSAYFGNNAGNLYNAVANQ